MADDDREDEERASVRFSEGSSHLDFARNLKINLQPNSDSATGPRYTRFVARVATFLDLIQHGANLRVLELHIGDRVGTVAEMHGILTAVNTVRTMGSPSKST